MDSFMVKAVLLVSKDDYYLQLTELQCQLKQTYLSLPTFTVILLSFP
jgi:hypothetical protein